MSCSVASGENETFLILKNHVVFWRSFCVHNREIHNIQALPSKYGPWLSQEYCKRLMCAHTSFSAPVHGIHFPCRLQHQYKEAKITRSVTSVSWNKPDNILVSPNNASPIRLYQMSITSCIYEGWRSDVFEFKSVKSNCIDERIHLWCWMNKLSFPARVIYSSDWLQ